MLRLFHHLKCVYYRIRDTNVICKIKNAAWVKAYNTAAATFCTCSIPRFTWEQTLDQPSCFSRLMPWHLEALILQQPLPETWIPFPVTFLKLAWYFCTVLHRQITIKCFLHAPLAHAVCHLCSDHSHTVSVKMSYKKNKQKKILVFKLVP